MAEFEIELVRPLWLLALLPGIFILISLWRRSGSVGAWEKLVDPELRPYVLEGNGGRHSRWPLVLATFCFLLAVVVLAGPVWEQRPMPLLQAQQSQVIVLDVSRSMDTTDQKPSRMARAKHKVRDLLARSAGKQTALVVFSQVAYVVSPLTDDVATLEAFLPAIETTVVPVQGSRLEPAIVKAQELLLQAGNQSGSILLITDATATEKAISAATEAAAAGYSVSVLGVATEGGDPLRLPDGSLLEDAAGNIAITALDSQGLTRLAAAGEGVFTSLSVDSADINRLLQTSDAVALSEKTSAADSGRQVLQWIERAPWLLLLLLLLALPAFRRGLF